jgi:hypothetical protein
MVFSYRCCACAPTGHVVDQYPCFLQIGLIFMTDADGCTNNACAEVFQLRGPCTEDPMWSISSSHTAVGLRGDVGQYHCKAL